MGGVLGGVLLPLLLLTAALINCSLVSMIDLLVSLFILFIASQVGCNCQRRFLVSYYVVIFSLWVFLSHAMFRIVLAIEGDGWDISDARWAKLIGFIQDESWRSPSVVYFLVLQLSAVLVALVEVYGSQIFPSLLGDGNCLRHFSFFFDRIGPYFKLVCCLLLPAVQLVVGISHPSWLALPFFICSCIGLVDWSLTSNFLGLFRWWWYLLFYSGFNIILLYIYQLPIEIFTELKWIFNFIGLYKITRMSDWSEICSCVSILLFYVMLSCIRTDLLEMNIIIDASENSLTEQLLPSRRSFFIRMSRSGIRHTNILMKGKVFRTFCINFFTYGFPVSLSILLFWSFQFASLSAFWLLAYVGYLLYSLPSFSHLHRLNGWILVFILFWATTTYIFNVAFTALNKNLLKDTVMWETIGLWHYPIPGLFLLAQFCLGILVAISNLVNSSVFLYVSDRDGHPPNREPILDEKEETQVLVVATVAWGLRKSSHSLAMLLLLLISLKPGFLHAAYMVFYMIYLLSDNISWRIRQCLILLCEAHFALLYILQLNLISKALEDKDCLASNILSQLGVLEEATSSDFIKIATLACFCAIQNHAFDMLSALSEIVSHTPLSPSGWRILKAGLNKSVLSSVYTSMTPDNTENNSSQERRIAQYISAMGHNILSVYRSCGTYIVCLTIILTVYLVSPNYASFGYLFFLLLWMNGRQLIGKTRRRLWFPLKVYAVIIFIIIYGMSAIESFEAYLVGTIDLYPGFGYDPNASMIKNVWESLAVLFVIELYSYERRLSKLVKLGNNYGLPDFSLFSFVKRLLIWHSEKLLYLSLLYASLSPVSAFGFVYLLGLVICSPLPKSSRVPSKIFMVYSGFLLMFDYLFQMWGGRAEMFPSQKHSYLSFFMGLQLFKPGFFGLESGMRGKVLVIVACVLQYNVFCWLENMPSDNNGKSKGIWEEPCGLFNSTEEKKPNSVNVSIRKSESDPCINITPLLENNKQEPPAHNSRIPRIPKPHLENNNGDSKNYSKGHPYIWGGSKENHKWNKKWVLLLRKERLDMQKTTLKIYLKYCAENMFNLFGLEINMIALLVASFAVLNAVSLLYITSLAACVILPRRIIRRFWFVFVVCFASILTLEYLASWLNVTSWKHEFPSKDKVACHDCWRNSNLFFVYCKKCWLGVIVDDPRMLISYYVVFVLACFKLRADHISGQSSFRDYQRMKKSALLINLSFETKSMWTFLDNLRLYCYCHLMDLVLALILLTGTLEFDILHLGYLGFALCFFRRRLEILKKKNKVFKFLRMYNFALIVFSLAYQAPFIGGFGDGKCDTIDYIYEVIGFYKYDYGFRITSRSALVEIIIFMLVALQSYMFSSQEFDYVSKYLEAEHIDALVREQEKRAAWKTTQLQHIRESEDEKRLRNFQVEKMKAEMLNLQIQLHSTNAVANCGNASPGSDTRRRISSLNSYKECIITDNKDEFGFRNLSMSADTLFPFELNTSPTSLRTRSPSRANSIPHSVDSIQEYTELKDKPFSNDFIIFDRKIATKKQNPITSAVHLFGDGVHQVKSLSNKAVTNLVNYFNIEFEEQDSGLQASENEVYYELENKKIGSEPVEQTFSVESNSERNVTYSTSVQIGIIFRYMWAQMRSNNDVVCYCSFVLVFLWNFSLLSMVYLAALFLYALCVNTGPGYMFWVITLIYSEICILLQYLYQIIIQHCGFTLQISFLQELGFSSHKIASSFVIGNLPLFLVYIFTLLQTSITARDGQWASVTEFSSIRRRILNEKEPLEDLNCWEKLQKFTLLVIDSLKVTVIGLYRYWKSVTEGAETPPYFVQLSMEVRLWPNDGIQPERIESGINKLLKTMHDLRCIEKNRNFLDSPSMVRIQSIERSPENPSVALAVLEVVYVSPSTEPVPGDLYKSLTPAADVANEIKTAHHGGVCKQTGFPYPILSVIGGGRRELDLYAYIFCADLAVFFLVAIFYQTVIKNNSEFLEVYQLEDQFPKEFVFILMIIFFLIVLDRIIYLCSFATGKVLFYLFTLVLFTYSVIKYAWNMQPSHEQHAGRFALRAIFLTKAISLALQAKQIRYGIPHESTLYRQFLTSSVSHIYYLGFRLYRALPFLYELRCVLDWSCTTTSLTMYDWLKLEDIHASLFLVKCDVDLNRVRHQQGEKQSKMTKFCNGICLFFVLLCVIWAPMLMYSSGNPTNIANPIKDASVQIDLKTIDGKLTLFETTLCKKLSWYELDKQIDLDPEDYLSSYNENDIQLICCQSDASTLWLVPPVVQARFRKSIKWSMDFVFSWTFTRDRPKGKEVVKYDLHIQDDGLPGADEVLNVLNGTSKKFRIFNVYPRYFRVTGSGDVRFLEQAVEMVSGDLVLNHGNPGWWSFRDVNASDIRGCGGLSGPTAIIVSEETPQGILGETLSKFSIWGLYITFVLAVGRFIRLQCSDLRMRIPYENLPSCDRLLAICEDIYSARAEGELEVEEVLYWTLVKIYRSPHMLLEYTKLE